MIDELLPCPFCGNCAKFKPYKRDGLTLKCETLGCVSVNQRTMRYSLEWLKGKMVESWNTRATLSNFSASTVQPAQPAKQQSQPTNIAPCEVLRNHGKCWRNACVVAGACTAPPVQSGPTLRQTIYGANNVHVSVYCKVSDVRAALDDAERLRNALTALVRNCSNIEVLGEWSATDTNINSGKKLRVQVDACIAEAIAAIKATS